MSKQNNSLVDNLVAFFGIALLLSLVFYVFKTISKSVSTNIISEEGLAALKDPKKRNDINQDIENAISRLK